jgi:hypothetical protein
MRARRFRVGLHQAACILASLPLLLAGIGCSALFHRLERRPWPRMLHWVLLPAGFLLAAVLLAAANIFYLRWLAETLVPAWEVWTSRLGCTRVP